MGSAVSRAISGCVKRQVICLHMLNRTHNAKHAEEGHTRIRRRRSDKRFVRECTQHTKRNGRPTANTAGEGMPTHKEIQGYTYRNEKRALTPKPKKGRRVHFPGDWESVEIVTPWLNRACE